MQYLYCIFGTVSGKAGSTSSNPAELFSRLVQLGIINEGEGPQEGGVTPPRQQPMTSGQSGVQLPTQQSQGPVERGPPPVPFAIPKLALTVATLKK